MLLEHENLVKAARLYLEVSVLFRHMRHMDETIRCCRLALWNGELDGIDAVYIRSRILLCELVKLKTLRRAHYLKNKALASYIAANWKQYKIETQQSRRNNRDATIETQQSRRNNRDATIETQQSRRNNRNV
jgi:hypothetical protein